MAIGNPSMIMSNEIIGLTRSPAFAQLSPASQAAFLRLAQQPPGSTQREFSANIAAYQPAFDEARQKGMLNNAPLWQEILKGTAIAGGVAAAGPVIGALTGSGAAAPPSGVLPATATVGPTGALAPAVAPATDFAAGTTMATAAGTGGLLSTLGRYGGVLGDLGQILGNASASDANARRQDAANNAHGIAENNAAKVQAAQFNLGLPSVRTNQVARGEVLNTMQNAPATGDPRIDKFSGGGLRPSAFGPQSREAGSILASTAMNGLQHPETDRLTPQEIPPYSPSTLDTVGAGAGLGLDIFSLLSRYGSNPNGQQRNPNGLPPYYPSGSNS